MRVVHEIWNQKRYSSSYWQSCHCVQTDRLLVVIKLILGRIQVAMNLDRKRATNPSKMVIYWEIRPSKSGPQPWYILTIKSLLVSHPAGWETKCISSRRLWAWVTGDGSVSSSSWCYPVCSLLGLPGKIPSFDSWMITGGSPMTSETTILLKVDSPGEIKPREI